MSSLSYLAPRARLHPAYAAVVQAAVAAGAVGDDLEMLEDLIAAATNDAVGKVEAAVQAKYAGITAGMKLPPGMKMPF
jgi:DNA-binding protein YbaB